MLLRHGPHSFWFQTVSRTRIWVILKSEFIELNDVTMFCVVLPRCVMEFNQISRYSLFVGSFKYSCNASISTGWVYIHHNTFVKTHRYQVNMHLLFLLEVGWWFESLSNCFAVLYACLDDCICVFALWAWCEIDSSIWSIRQRAWSMPMVYAID